MSADISVDLDGLLALVEHLKRIRKDVFQLGQGWPPAVAGGTGQPLVQEALDDFRNEWAYGIDLIAQEMDAASGLAKGAHDAYLRVETDISNAAHTNIS